MRRLFWLISVLILSSPWRADADDPSSSTPLVVGGDPIRFCHARNAVAVSVHQLFLRGQPPVSEDPVIAGRRIKSLAELDRSRPVRTC